MKERISYIPDEQQPIQSSAVPVDINNPAALKALAMSRLEEIVRTAPANVSLVAAIRELIDRIEGKAPQSITMDVKDKRLNESELDSLLRLAAHMRDPLIIPPMPKKLE